MGDNSNKQEAASSSPERRRFVFASLSLGFCFAAFESKRYTALWPFEAKGGLLIFSIMVAVVLFAFCLLYFSRKHDYHVRNKRWLFLALVALQTLGLIGQFLYSQGIDSPLASLPLFSLLTEASYLMLFFCIDLFLSFNTKRTIEGFAIGFVIAGAIQILICFFVAPIMQIIAFLLAPLGWIFFQKALPHQSSEKVLEIPQVKSSASPSGYLVLIYLAIFLVCILFIGIHANITIMQDGGIQSLMMQVSLGLGTLLAGLMIFLFLDGFKKQTVIEVCCILMFPPALAALYLSVLFGISAYPALVLVGFAYAINLLLIWVIPHIYESSLPKTFLAYLGLLVKKAGWGVGLYMMMIVPQNSSEGVSTIFMIVLFIVLTAIILVIFLKGVLQSKNSPASTSPASNSSAIARERLAEVYGFTPREKEVFDMLAAGRTAPHIAKTLVISEGTARTHIVHIYRKMEIKSQQSLMDKVDMMIAEIESQGPA